MEQQPVVTVEVERELATITLDSPANRNALSRRLVDELLHALDTAESSGARVIVLTHAGPTFCAGADLKERAGGSSDSTGFVAVLQRLAGSTRPVIAAVAGSVRAGGIGLMAACDLVVVAPTTTFAFTEVRLGVAPAIISVPILQRCTWSKLAAPFLTGEVFDAAAAREMGLVTHVDPDVSATARRLAEGVRAGGREAVTATKALLRAPERSFSEMQRLSEELFGSDDAQEAMRAFAEGRPPAWRSP